MCHTKEFTCLGMIFTIITFSAHSSDGLIEIMTKKNEKSAIISDPPISLTTKKSCHQNLYKLANQQTSTKVVIADTKVFCIYMYFFNTFNIIFFIFYDFGFLCFYIFLWF